MDTDNRINILNRMRSKNVSIEEFDYDKLQAPPLNMLFTPQDIAQLHYIATSLKLSAKPQIKYKMINDIMRARGFEKMAAGTNRVVYRFIEDQSFVVKVAYDAVGIHDNPAEFKNQFLIKPFCCKCFEVSPDGVIGIFERVQPITNREEFISVADDIFTLIDEWLVNGEYVLADIGSKFFMNYGIRTSFPFGPVIIDYPYIYKLDGNKLFCSKPDPNSPTGRCDGEIDYDDGFNFLRCKKCGAIYKAEELKKQIDNNNIIVKNGALGGFKMKISIHGGSKNVNKTKVIDEVQEAKSVPTKPVRSIKVKFTTDVDEEKDRSSGNFKMKTGIVHGGSKHEVQEESLPTKPIKSIKVKLTDDDEDEEKENIPVKEYVRRSNEEQREKYNKIKNEKDSSKNDDSKKNAKNPFTKDEGLKEKSREELLDEYLDKISAIVKSYPEEDQAIFKAKITNKLDLKEDTEDTSVVPLTADAFKNAADKMIRIIDNIDDGKQLEEAMGYDNIIKFIKEYYDIRLTTNDGSVSVSDDGEISIGATAILGAKYDEEEEDRVAYAEFDTKLDIDPENSKGLIEYLNDAVKGDDNDDKITGFTHTAAVTVNIKDLFPAAPSQKVIVPINKDGNYTSIDGKLIAIDKIDDRDLDHLSIVSSDWLAAKEDELSEEDSTDTEDNAEVEEANDDEEEEDVIEAPTGALPPMGVNGVVTEE